MGAWQRGANATTRPHDVRVGPIVSRPLPNKRDIHLIVIETARKPIDEELFSFALLHCCKQQLDGDLNRHNFALFDV